MTEQQFDTPGPVKLEVTFAAGDVQIATVDGHDSTVTLEGSQRLLDATRVELIGDRLVIQQRRRSFTGLFDRIDNRWHVQARIPHGSRVEIVTASGDAALGGAFGAVQMKSASGELSVTGEVAGDAKAETVSGQVRLPHVAGDLTARTVSADVAADSVDGSVSVKSVSGRLHVGSLREGTTTVQSVSGSVDLGIAPGTSIDIDAGSASGQLSSDIPLAEAPNAQSGPTVVIRGNTVSGDFRVFRAA
jgi:hypothetical protein